MSKEVMKRTAADNEYLHKDFHLSLNMGIEYLREKYGDEGVREYLEEFAQSYYSPLKEDLKKRGLCALKEHYEKIYRVEKSHIETELSPDELTVKILSCPAVDHMKKNNIKPSQLYYETTKKVNETICKGTPYDFELVEYEDETGKAELRFYRRQIK